MEMVVKYNLGHKQRECIVCVSAAQYRCIFEKVEDATWLNFGGFYAFCPHEINITYFKSTRSKIEPCLNIQ